MTLLALLVACDTLEGACTGLGFDADTCGEPLVPLSGPWVADPDPGDVCGVDAATLSEGWVVEPTDAGFSLAAPGGEPADCAQDGATFACAAAAGPGGLSIVASGTLGSRSTADLSLQVVADVCDVTLVVPFVAAWKTIGPESGTCPRDYDDFQTDEDQPQVTFTIENRSAVTLGLYVISDGSDVFVNPVDAGGSQTSSTYRNGWMALATDWGAESCVWMFQVREEGHLEIYEGE